MAKLEQLELVYQPYNSAGRMPTSKGLRAFVNYLMQDMPDHFLNEKNDYSYLTDTKKLADFVHNICFELSKNTKEISFFLIPEKSMYSYTGIANFLESNMTNLGTDTLKLIQVIEDKNSFSHFIQNLPLTSQVNVFIGEENITHFLKDYTIIVKKITLDGYVGYV